MTSIRDELVSKWTEAASAKPGDREWRAVALSISATVRFLAGIREPDGRIALLIEAPLSAAPNALLRISAEGVSLSDRRDAAQGLFRVAVALEREPLRDIFEVLAADLVEVVRQAATPAQAVALGVSRLEAWQAFLRSGRRGLSREEQIGLLGELTILELLAAEIGYEAAVEGWFGPLDGIHDFSRSGVGIEVKAVAGGGNLVRISRLDQLDRRGLSTLLIARPRFQEAPGGRTVLTAVRDVRDALDRSAAGARPAFDDRLLRLGLVEMDRQASPFSFVLQDLYGFEVRENFPRLTGLSVPQEIVDASYSLDERLLGSFLIDIDGLSRFLRMMGRTS
ncbi:PD-(D/E)XK motif protein [Bradyrhizobium pachyrhizi]|uniref:PD-(D/E)XK motif protein n=1 Tax=Bradyrhizobium pachyrhizi TaxID=280333 RepID=UPI0024B1ACAB|nr:PD-(D/E)XK motif protein [Bradyrhizobium pachyrhizi]WFU55725.1 PD-(D/E)XK motif protein [Bradyrhizobium pachyrhizi]